MTAGTSAARRFERPVQIRFAHCDPAGIIFFPQYLVLFNGLVEDWFNDALRVPYADMVQKDLTGLPIVHLESDFRAVTRMGEVAMFSLEVEKFGNRSLTLAFQCHGADGELRVSARKVLVFTDLQTHKSISAPAHIRSAIESWTAASDNKHNA